MSFLGIDIGTTTCKVCLIDDQQRVVSEFSVSHNASIQCENPLFSEQCPKKIIRVVVDLMKRLDLKELKAVCTSGQMHDIILWDKNGDFSGNDWPCSHVITWMDQRCDTEFLASLPVWTNAKGNQEAAMSTGYGLATLAWLEKNKMIPDKWNSCGTIMDFFNFLLTKKCGFMSDQLAYSFGCYVVEENEWQEDCKQFVSKNLLPKIVPSNFVLGKLDNFFDFSCPKDVRIYVALGDLQTSLYKVLESNQAVLHIGTSSQLAFSVPSKPDFNRPELLRVPYFNGQCLIVAASLNGGNTLELVSTKISQFYSQLFNIKAETKLPNGKIDELLNEALNTKSPLTINPKFYGERHDPNAGASVDGFQAQTSVAQLFGATATGIIYNLSRMLPQSLMKQHGIQKVRLLNRATHPLFERASHKHFNELEILKDHVSSVSAAFGAACFACEIGQ